MHVVGQSRLWKLFSPFRLCIETHTVSPHGTDSLCIWKSFWELWLSDECAWVVWNRLTAFSEGTKVSLKFLGVLCNASCWQIWEISFKCSSRKKAFFQEKDLDAEWEEGVFASYVWNVFVLKATIRLGVNYEPGLYSWWQGKMESVVYQSAGLSQGAHIHYSICIILLALYL